MTCRTPFNQVILDGNQLAFVHGDGEPPALVRAGERIRTSAVALEV